MSDVSNISTNSKKRVLGKLVFIPVLAIAVVFGILFTPVQSTVKAASGTITGSVTCFYGNNNESGVWVNASSGTDGWATLTSNGQGGKNYSYTLSQSSSYRLHVGCGGTSQSWGATMYSPWVSGQSYNWVCSYSHALGYFCATS